MSQLPDAVAGDENPMLNAPYGLPQPAELIIGKLKDDSNGLPTAEIPIPTTSLVPFAVN
jgi:hypothetical protein